MCWNQNKASSDRGADWYRPLSPLPQNRHRSEGEENSPDPCITEQCQAQGNADSIPQGF